MRDERPAAAILLLAFFGHDAAAGPDPAATFDADCDRPAWNGDLPDPATATQEQMVAAQRSVKAFDQAVAAYGECLAAAETRLIAAGGDAGPILEARAQRNDGAVGDAERLATEFNTRLKSWRGRQQVPEAQPARQIGVRTDPPPERCYPRSLRLAGVEMTGKVVVWVDVDGTASVQEWPPGVSREQRQAFECVIGNLRFAPATRGGEPFRSSIEMSINFGLTNDRDETVKITPPSQASGAEEMTRFRAECVSADIGGGGESVIESTIDPSGRVTRTKVVTSSGDDAVDRAARCIMEKTLFQPGTRNGVPTRMKTTSSVRIATPASAPRGAGPPPATGTTPP